MKKIYPMFLFMMLLAIQHLDAQQWMPVGVASTNIIRGMHFLSEDTGYVSTEIGEIARTTDGGVNWVQQTSGVTTALRSVFFRSVNEGFACGFGGVILKTTDGGATWTDIGDTIVVNLRCIQFTSGDVGYVARGGGVIHRTTDGGATWSPYDLGTTSDVIQLRFINEQVGFAVASGSVSPFGAGFVYKTTDGGDTWNMIHSDPMVGFLGLAVANENYIVIGGAYQTIKQSTDGGNSWSIVTQSTAGTPSFRGGAAASDSNIYMIDDAGSVFSTVDGGTNWSDTLVSLGFYSISFPTPDVGYTGDAAGNIYKLELPCSIPIPVVTFTDGVLYSSASSGNQWYYNGSIIPGATNATYVPTQNGTYTVTVTDDTGCSETSAPFDVIGVGVEDPVPGNAIEFYPNPVSDFAVISYPENMNIEKGSLVISDIQGKIICIMKDISSKNPVLNLSSLAPGMYHFRINDANNTIAGHGKFIVQ